MTASRSDDLKLFVSVKVSVEAVILRREWCHRTCIVLGRGARTPIVLVAALVDVTRIDVTYL